MHSFERISAASRLSAAQHAHDGPIAAPGLTYTGSSDDNYQVGTANDDEFKYGQGGDDTIFGAGGDDQIKLGGKFTTDDRINGGTGYDVMLLNGDYYFAVQPSLGPQTLFAVEEIRFGAGNDYVLTFNDANVAAGEVLTIDATELNANHFTSIDTRQEADGLFVYKGGAGLDGLYVGQDGNTVNAGAGDDFMYQYPDYTGATRFDGGAGVDFLSTLYSVSSSVTLAAASVRNLEWLITNAKPNSGDITIHLVLHDANVGAGQTMLVSSGNTTGATTAVFYDGSAERDGTLRFGDNNQDDTMIGGKGGDRFDLYGGGTDWMRGGQGNDLFVVSSATLGAADRLDGGKGADVLQLSGDYSGGLIFGATTMVGVETILLVANSSYVLAADDATAAAGTLFTVDGSALGAAHTLYFNGSPDTDARFALDGGAGSDTLIGALQRDVLFGRAGDDQLQGQRGGDRMSGGNGGDTFLFVTLADSRAADPDLITDFGGADLIHLSVIDADAATGGDQAFHFGKTPGRVGDITAKYDAVADQTVVKLYVNADDIADAVLWLKGNHTLSAGDFVL